MEIKVIKDGTTEEMVYNGLELLEEFATKLLNQNDNAVTLETLQQDNELLLTFVKTYRLLTNRSTACFLTEIKSLKWYNISIQRRF